MQRTASTGKVPKIRWVGRQDFDVQAKKMFKEMCLIISRNAEIHDSWRWCGEVENIEEIYRSSDCIVLPSLFEGLPNVVCESMLYGCPILASRVSDIPELLGNNERGILFNPNLPEEICDALEFFEEMSLEGRQRMIKNARKFAVREFDQKIMVNKYIKIAHL